MFLLTVQLQMVVLYVSGRDLNFQVVLLLYMCREVSCIAVMHPMEVAASLQKRNGLPLVKGLGLWLRYNLEGEYHSRGYRRHFVYFPELLENLDQTLVKASITLRVDWPRPLQDARAAVDRYLDASMRRNRLEDYAGGADLISPVALVFDVLKRACRTQVVDFTALERGIADRTELKN